MNNIPAKLKKEMSEDPYYQKCCITGDLATNTKIEWHHNFQYAGRQVQEKWCILPLSKWVHDHIQKYKERCDWIMLNRATDDELRKFDKRNLIGEREKLNKIYGTRS